LSLTHIEGDEVAQPELEGCGDMEHIQGTAPEFRSVGATAVGGAPQRCAPQDVDFGVPALTTFRAVNSFDARAAVDQSA
jgi:hypothetical protein